MSQELLTVDELAEHLKVPKSWIYSRTREKGPDSIPRIQAGKYIRFRIPPCLWGETGFLIPAAIRYILKKPLTL